MAGELKKLFLSRLMLICAAVTVGVFGVFVYRTVKYNSPGNETFDERRSFIASVSEGRSRAEIGAYISTRITQLNEQISACENDPPIDMLNELFMCISVQDKLGYIERVFPENRRALITDALAASERERAKQTPDESVIALNELAAEKYNQVIDLKLTEEGRLSELLVCLDNTYWDYLMMLLAVITAVRMFTLDYSSGAYRMIHPVLKSRRGLFVRQLAAAYSVTAAAVILTAASQLIVGVCCFGIGDLSLPIQQFSEFEYCPYRLTVGGFLALKLGMKLLFYLWVTAAAAMMSVLTKKAGFAMPVTALAAAAPQMILTVLFVYTASDNASALDSRYIAFDRLRTVLPQGFLNLKAYFFRFDYVTLFGVPVSRLGCAAAVTCLMTALCIFVSYRKFAAAR